MKKLLAATPLLLLAAACVGPYGESPYGDGPYGPGGYPGEPYPGPYPAPYPGPPTSSDYRAVGTEPFWDLTIGRDLVFTDRVTGLTVVQPRPAPINGVAGEIYRTPRLEVNIVHKACNDGMSDRSFPDTVQVYVDGRLYRGCGGAPGAAGPLPPPGSMAPPLDRTRWRVLAVNGRPVPPVGDYSIEFDNGRLSARLGCNGLGATYTQTGASLDAGPLVGTKMACPDMSWETQGSAVLNSVMQVSAMGPDRLTLSSSAGTIELQRR